MTVPRNVIEKVCEQVVKGIAQADFDFEKKFTTSICGGVTVDIMMHDVVVEPGCTDGTRIDVGVKGINIVPTPGTSWAVTWREMENGRKYIE